MITCRGLCRIEQFSTVKYAIMRRSRPRARVQRHVNLRPGQASFAGDAMAKPRALESRWPGVLDIPLVPAVARLPATIPVERRNVAAREALVRRIHSEFEEMPGLSLTVVQASKLFGVSLDAGSRILLRLTEERRLRLRSDGRYMLLTGQS
jgi:hypothetical protein